MLAPQRASANLGPYNVDSELCGNPNHNKSHSGPVKSASIRDKISQWEGKKEPSPPSSSETVVKDNETVRKKEHKPSDPDSKRVISLEKQDSLKENVGKVADFKAKPPEGLTPNKDREVFVEWRLRPAIPQENEKKSVLTHVKKLERATKEVPVRPSLAFPGNYFCSPSKEELEESEKKTEPIFGTFYKIQHRGPWQRRKGSIEHVYNEPGNPSINPLPKPQRTFQHSKTPSIQTSVPGCGKGRKNLPPLPSIPLPPLPTCPPPGVCRRPWTDKPWHTNNR